MARVRPVEPSTAAPPVADALERARREIPLFLNQMRTLAHLPGLVGRFVDLYAALPRESLLPRPLVELAVLTVSALNACEYCLIHHAALGAQYGLTPLQVHSFRAGGWRELPLGETERLVVEYAEQVTRDANRVSDALFEQLRARFTDPQIVELTLRITLCGFFNKLNQALRIDVEPEAPEAFAAIPSAPRPPGDCRIAASGPPPVPAAGVGE